MLNSDYLLNLNEKQQEAVEHLDGPLLIVAGAGSGKTKVLTSRIAHIIRSHKAFSSQILAVTFTNKAAKEMQIRVSKILGKEATGLPWLGTFHSISAKILRKHADAVGLKSNLGFGVAGADFLYLSRRYCSYNFGSINFIKFAKFCPWPQLWHLKNISFLTLYKYALAFVLDF